MTGPCNLGVGCDEAGVCYAGAHGTPLECGRGDVIMDKISKDDLNDMCFFQAACVEWGHQVFAGTEITSDPLERSLRFAEEALELVQSTGLTREEVLKVVDYVFNRPKGEIGQEVGGTIVCLAMLCEANQLSLTDEAVREFVRVDSPEMREKIKTKHAAKREAGLTSNGGFR